MKKYVTGIGLICILLTNCTQDIDTYESIDREAISQLEPYDIDFIKSTIIATLEATGDFKWENVSDHFLWSVIIHGDSTAGIGYSKEIVPERDSINTQRSKQEVIDIIEKNERNKTESSILFECSSFTMLHVRISKLETIKELKRNPNVRYIQPGIMPSIDAYNDSVDDMDSENNNLIKSGGTYKGSNINPQDLVSINLYGRTSKVSWAFVANGISSLWQYYNAGEGIWIGNVDTGVNLKYALSPSNFNSTYSRESIWDFVYCDHAKILRFMGRNDFSMYSPAYQKLAIRDPWDRNEHGTFMASILTAPFGVDNIIAGVAHRANIHAVKAANNVILETLLETDNVALAIKRLVDSRVKVISISMGWILEMQYLNDALKYADSQGVIIVGAGGTSSKILSEKNRNFAIYPGKHPSVISVTGLKQDGSLGSNCHWHTNDIDFSLYVERSGNGDRKSPTSGYDSPMYYVGGSSTATAMLAGIIAIYLKQNPTANKQQVINWLSQHAISDHRTKFGRVNVNQSVQVKINQSRSGNNYTFTAIPNKGKAPYYYSWSYSTSSPNSTNLPNSSFSYANSIAYLDLLHIDKSIRTIDITVTITDSVGNTSVALSEIFNPYYDEPSHRVQFREQEMLPIR
jgi:serine protease